MPRTSLQAFSEANAAYIGATVTVYQAKPDGTADLLNKATLYMNLTGPVTLPNPQELDSEGKWQQPVYFEDDVVLAVQTSTFSHETGVIRYGGQWRGFYAPGGTRYVYGDIIQAQIGEAEQYSIYQAQSIFLSNTWALDKVDATKLVKLIDYQMLAATVVPDATEAVKGKALIADLATAIARADNTEIMTAVKVHNYAQANGLAFDAATLAYHDAMTVKPTIQRSLYLDNMIVALKAAGLWTKIGLMYVMAAHDAQAARVNVKSPGTGNLVATNAPTFTTDSGYAGNGANASLDTGLAYNALPLVGQNDIHISAYVMTDVAENASIISPISGTYTYLNPKSAIGNLVTRLNQAAPDDSIANPDGRGFYVLSRAAAGLYARYKDGTLLDSPGSASSGLSAAALSLLRSATSFSTCRVGFVTVGSSLNATEQGTLNTIVRTYLLAIGAITAAASSGGTGEDPLFRYLFQGM